MRVVLLLVLLVMAFPYYALGETPSVPATSPSAGGTPDSANPSPIPDTYRIAPGDTLSIVVIDEDLFTRECQVNGAGTISYPMLGDVPVSGVTCGDLRGRLETDLGNYLKAPDVTVTVRQYGTTGMSVFVMGEVKTPGVYPLVNGGGYIQALAAAGGMNETASGEVSLVKARTRQSSTFMLGDGEGQGPMLEPGDVILVLRKREMRYAVLGEVPKPGMFDMPVRGEVRVLDALEKAGLFAPKNGDPTGGGRYQELISDPGRAADLEHARLIRGEIAVSVDLTALLRGDSTQNPVLQSGDVLTVPRRAVLMVYAMGEVRNPGRISLPRNATVLDLLNAAGGTTTTARPSQGRIVRTVNNTPTSIPVNIGDLLGKGDQKQNLALQDGDVLFIPPRGNDTEAWRTVIAVLPFLRGW